MEAHKVLWHKLVFKNILITPIEMISFVILCILLFTFRNITFF